jgi:hypothetical protein
MAKLRKLDKKTKIEWLEDFYHLHHYLKFPKAMAIEGILKKRLMCADTYEQRKVELLALVEKNKTFFEGLTVSDLRPKHKELLTL